MKCTSFLISKQLAEAGFKAKTNWVWAWSGDDHQKCCYNDTSDEAEKEDFLSYDLETLLETLPNFIANKNKGENCLTIDVAFGEIYYESDSDNDALFITTTGQNESLADIAAKLWLKLKKEGLV